MINSKKVDKEKLNIKIHHAGYKITPPRTLLINILYKTKNPLTINQIISRLRKEGVNRATVYRNLKVLEDSSIIQQIDFRDKGIRYELIDKNNHHHHLVCTKCKKTEDFYNCSVERIVNSVLKKSSSFSIVESHTMEFFGVCRKCIKN